MELGTVQETTTQRELCVAICGDVTVDKASAAQELVRCADALDPALNVTLAPIDELPNSLDAVDRIFDPNREAPLDLLIISERLPGLSGTSLVREIRAIDRCIAIVMTASDENPAYDALTLGVTGYLMEPVAADDFRNLIAGVLTDIAAQRAETVALRFRDRARRVAKHDILFAETAGHDQVVHLRNGDEPAMRCSSQALFDLLSPETDPDPRFFKAGSSFVVNLSHIRSFERDGSAALDNGATVSVPVRLRPAFTEALLAFSSQPRQIGRGA